MRNLSLILFCLLIVSACHNTGYEIGVHPSIVISPVTVKDTDSSLHLVNGRRYYAEKPFSGYIESYFPSGRLKSKQSFYNGVEEGLLSTYYENGNKDTRRYFHAGEKDSINQGWWPDGTLAFEYHFKRGVYDGDFKEWYETGKPLKHIVYRNGKEQSGIGWRANGKVYMSFAVKDGRLYGLINPNLCYSLKNERGEFVMSE